jgi:anti-sigma-K factor RskA
MSPEERQIQAGEYVLGTLPADERVVVERALPVDDNLRAAVRAWEERLAPLAARLPDRAPPAHVWTALERALGSAPGRSGAGEVVPFANPTAIDALRRSRAIWRGSPRPLRRSPPGSPCSSPSIVSRPRSATGTSTSPW